MRRLTLARDIAYEFGVVRGKPTDCLLVLLTAAELVLILLGGTIYWIGFAN